MDYELPSGLVVTDRRHQRAAEVPQIDPHDHTPNGNAPASTVGPESRGGTHVMYPTGGWHAETWDGWPTEWDTPWYGPAWSGYGSGRLNHLWGNVSTAMTCVDLNSRQLASFPAYGMKANVPFTLPDWYRNPSPELYSCWAEFMHQSVNAMYLRGECFTLATGRYADGRVARFIALNPDTVDVELIDGRLVYTLAGAELDPADIIHIKYQSWPGSRRGISPIEWVGHSLATSTALEHYGTGLATRGGIPWAVLKSRSNIGRPQAEDIQASWVRAANRRDGAPAVMGGDLDLTPLTLSPRDMALLELREFDERRICAAFGVPPFIVAVSQQNSMTYSNVNQIYDAHWRQTLRPIADLLASAWSSWLLPRGSHLEFNADRYTQPPLGERVGAWATLFGIVDPATGERALSVAQIQAAERILPAEAETSADSGERLTGGRV